MSITGTVPSAAAGAGSRSAGSNYSLDRYTRDTDGPWHPPVGKPPATPNGHRSSGAAKGQPDGRSVTATQGSAK
ncbi:hypothetical protein CDD81_1091 [Ophiocordyceps australis]|uniref:Uncharacterized protein n=1 Tax=Ophiocordyceps australis TaxID=1399860 RepID=A0A2C5XZP7_9HYPO|nr:hypothetical protein CDD81_1091 [Ophiocordyceps australis]